MVSPTSRRFWTAVALSLISAVLVVTVLFATTESQLEDVTKSSIKHAVKEVDKKLHLTKGGKHNHIKWRQSAMCNEKHEPHWWKVWEFKKIRSLTKCVEYDLSLRRRPLGDNGLRVLTNRHLSGPWLYGDSTERHLRVLNLARQGITRRGAGYLARWLSPIMPWEDVDQPATAIDSAILINLEGNPISVSGRKMLERAVEEARLQGIRATITGGGPCTDPGGKGGLLIKLGPVEMSKPILEMEPWRIPAPWWNKWWVLIRSLRLQVMLALIVGYVLGRARNAGKKTSFLGRIFPYRLAVVHRDHFENYNGDGFVIK